MKDYKNTVDERRYPPRDLIEILERKKDIIYPITLKEVKRRKRFRFIKLLYYKIFKWRDCPHLCCICEFRHYCYEDMLM